MLSQKKIDEMIKKHKNALLVLEEYENTGKIILKSRMNFTIDKEISKKFKDYCKRERINMSKVMEEAMRKYIK